MSKKRRRRGSQRCGDCRVTTELLDHLEKAAAGDPWRQMVNEAMLYLLRSGLITYKRMPDGDFLWELSPDCTPEFRAQLLEEFPDW
jgi:hypothetical protein